jgi:hypothetical protein
MSRKAFIRPVLILATIAVAELNAHAQAAAKYCSRQNLIVSSFANHTQGSFCWDIRAREGLFIQHAYFKTSPAQGGVERKVLDRAHVAQLFVPYDAASPRYHDFDYSLGNNVRMLTTADCSRQPASALRRRPRVPGGRGPGHRLLGFMVARAVQARGSRDHLVPAPDQQLPLRDLLDVPRRRRGTP